jgi:S-DNA-T family DNA segregation ATPase FtsK/SpoIIIE
MAGKNDTGGLSLKRDLWGFVLLGLCVIVFLALYSYQSADVGAIQSPPNSPTQNLIGVFGAWTGFLVFMGFGLGGFLVPIVFGLMGLLFMLRRDDRLGFKTMWLWICLFGIVCLLELLPDLLSKSVAHHNTCGPGGLLGMIFAKLFLIRFIGDIGSWIVLGALVLTGIVILLEIQPVQLLSGVGAGSATAAEFLRQKAVNLLDRGDDYEEEEGAYEEDEDLELELAQVRKKIEQSVKEKEKREKKAAKPKAKPKPKTAPKKNKKVAAPVEQEEEVVDSVAAVAPTISTMKDIVAEEEDEEEEGVLVIRGPEEDAGGPSPEQAAEESAGVFANLKKKKPAPAPVPVATPKAKIKVKPTIKKIMQNEPVDPEFEPVMNPGEPREWKLPPISLLEEPKSGTEVDEAEVMKTAQVLKDTLAEFNVEADIMNVECGPVVTSIEIRPAPGVKVEKISALSNNLALALRAESIRVQAPVPGKGVVGVEIPNAKSDVVYARGIIESKSWRSPKIALPLCLGVDVSGRKIVGDLADMPHLLIAGATGSGKSVCMNSLLAGLLMSRTPDQLRLILVDPKIVEFTAFNDLPHLVVPVITDAKKVSLGLRWAINEMEKRYKLFAKVGVRNIKSYNTRKVERQPDLFDDGSPEAKDRPPETLPYIVIVIDELADLMMVAQQEIEGSIARLAQLSRAVGIHMILATQRPSVNVITGTIKANFPARIAFQVAQKVDSRTILDAIGADKLLGKGDMLFLPPGTGKLVRSQGAMTTDDEINRIVEFIKAQGKPEYEMQVKAKIESKVPELPSSDEDDELVNQAVEIIRQTRRASTSSLQRRLRIGYNRAARLMDTLEERGLVGPPQGSDPREILIDLDGEVPENTSEYEQGATLEVSVDEVDGEEEYEEEDAEE